MAGVSMVALLGLVFVGVIGCESTPKSGAGPREYIDVTTVELRDDIYAIRQMWPQFPWLTGPDGDVKGFRVTMYFVSSETEKGAFVPGKILAWLYQIERQPGGGYERELLHGWELDEQGAMPYRVRRLVVPGYPYMFMLVWPPDVEVAGKTVEIEFAYERTDGRVVIAPAHRLDVPLAPGQRRAAPRTKGAGRGPG